MSRTNIRLSGFGGQGIIMAGVIIAKAAVEHDGIYATQTQSYGVESRGGACMANVVLSSEIIDYPEPEELDILVAMSQMALDRYIGDLVPNGTLILDSGLATSIPDDLTVAVYGIPATRSADEKLGRNIVANVVMLGAVAKLTGAVSISGLIAAMEDSVPQHMMEINERAIRIGVDLAQAVVS
jgi:2-oxoglutarate ferredoxin oxidoreductase subunit gamma